MNSSYPCIPIGDLMTTEVFVKLINRQFSTVGFETRSINSRRTTANEGRYILHSPEGESQYGYYGPNRHYDIDIGGKVQASIRRRDSALQVARCSIQRTRLRSVLLKLN